jgi:FkbM family methyltransferase
MLAGCGYSLRHQDPDPLMVEMDRVRDFLRLHPGRPDLWENALSQLALASHLRDLIRLHQPDLAVDVGANRGQFALHLRELGYHGPILSLEPQRALADALRPLAAETRSDWTIIHGAAGDANTELVLHTYADDTFSSFHTASQAARDRFGGLLTPGAPETVRVRPLDDWLEETAHAGASRILVKTDTQGHDLAVLRGAPRTIGKARIILAEAAVIPLYDHAPTLADFTALLTPANFRLAGQYAVSHDTRDLAVMESDCLFTRVP